MRWAGNVTRIDERRGVQKVLVGNLRERPLGRSWCRWEDYIKMDHPESGGMGRI